MINFLATEATDPWATTVQMIVFLSFIFGIVWMIWGRKRA